jgi:FdhE protein
MVIGEKDQQILASLAEARGQHAELTQLLDFYSDLYAVQFGAKALVAEPEFRDELAMRWRLEGGIPQLAFDQLPLEQEPFSELVENVMDVLLRHNPGWEPGQGETLQDGLLDLAREVFETWDTLTGPGPGTDARERTSPANVAALSAGLSLAPYLQRAAEAILPRLDLSLWSKGYCPICGGRPNFSLLDEETGAMQLMCSKCATLWGFPRMVCPFCDTEARPAYYPSDDGQYRLYVCSACRGYLKAVDLREVNRVVHPMVERLLTVGMDLAAQQEGYGA